MGKLASIDFEHQRSYAQERKHLEAERRRDEEAHQIHMEKLKAEARRNARVAAWYPFIAIAASVTATIAVLSALGLLNIGN